MHESKCNEIIYAGILAVSCERFMQKIWAVLLEQVRDESPACLLTETSYLIIKYEYSVLQNLLVQKGLFAFEIGKLRLECESSIKALHDAIQPFLVELRADSLAYSWIEAVAGDEDATVFAERYEQYINKVIAAFKLVNRSLIELRNNYPAIKGLRWNHNWLSNIPYPNMHDPL